MSQCCGLVAALLLAATPVQAGPTADACVVEIGANLSDLRALVGDAMGQAVECEQPLDGAGDTVQRTSTGTAWFTRASHSAMFTNGYQRWVLDSNGLSYWNTPEAVPLLSDGLADGVASWNSPAICAVLYTHEVPLASIFRRFLTRLIEAGFQPVSFAMVDASMRGEGELPPGCVVLSFDDALESQLRNAVPVLAEFGITGMFFVMPSFQDGQHQYLGASGIRALHDAGHIIGAHTCNHPSLPALGPLSMMAELDDCKHLVENLTGVPVRYFAYPNGAVNQVVLDAVARAGYRAAFTTRPSVALRPDQPLLLPRIRYDASEAVSTVAGRIRGAH